MDEKNSVERTRTSKRTRAATAMAFFGMMIFRLCFIVVFSLALAVVVMWLWNWLIPGLFGLGLIGYWQAFGLMILSRLILGTIGPGSGIHRPDSRRDRGDRFERHRSMCGDFGRHGGVENAMTWWHNYKRFWRDEGKAAFDTYMKAKEGETKGTTDKDKK